MVLQIILTKEEIELCLPSIKIRLVVGEDDRNATFDGNITDVGRIGKSGGGGAGGRVEGIRRLHDRRSRGGGPVGEVGSRHGRS